MEASRSTGAAGLVGILVLLVIGGMVALTALQGMGGTIGTLSSGSASVQDSSSLTALVGSALWSPAAVYEVKSLHPHAAKHQEAQSVWLWLTTHDTRFCRYECKGRTYYGCRAGGRWIFAVEDMEYTITAFFTTRDYVVGHTRDNPGCKPYMSGAHP